MLKLTDRKKEGNKLLRSIDADSNDPSQFCHEMNNFATALFNAGLDHIARLMFKEASKLHIFLSSIQRPVLNTYKEMETEMIWDMDNHVGLSTYDEEFTELKAFLPTLKKEATEAAKNIDGTQWYINQHREVSTGNYIVGKEGNFSVLPLFAYGKRRRMVCKDIMPETCKFLKKNFDRAINVEYGVVKLTVMDPKIKTLPLDGLTNMRLRLLVPIHIPEGFVMTLGEDTKVPLDREMMVIDESFEHRYDNEKGSSSAMWLSLDLVHPDVTPEEAKQLSVTAYAKNFFMSW